jgi:hypothetical protein
MNGTTVIGQRSLVDVLNRRREIVELSATVAEKQKALGEIEAEIIAAIKVGEEVRDGQRAATIKIERTRKGLSLGFLIEQIGQEPANTAFGKLGWNEKERLIIL